MSLTDYAEAALLNSMFGKTSDFGALAARPTFYVGLLETAPTEAGGSLSEPTGGAYARAVTAPTDWNAAAGTAPTAVTNLNVVTFPQATADWRSGLDLGYFGIWDAATAGNLIMFGALTQAKPVLNGDTPSFPAGTLSTTAD